MKIRYATSPKTRVAKACARRACEKRPVRFASAVVVAILAFMAVFTIVMTATFFIFKETPDALIACVFGVMATEFASLAAKRVADKKNSGKE